MTPRPEFAVIAGPNGAGKSRLSPFYIHGECFDGDALAMQLRAEYPEWEEHWYAGTVASTLEKQMQATIDDHRPFAFETNFSSQLPINMIHRFKEAGYKICLYYFGLDSLILCKERVAQRVAFGGHGVSDEVIKYNFEEGQALLSHNLHLFDNMTFIDGTTPFGNIVALYIAASHRVEMSSTLPHWFKTNYLLPFQKIVGHN